MMQRDPTEPVDVPEGYQCPLCSCRTGDSPFLSSEVVAAAICEGCACELSHFLEQTERAQDPVLDALESRTGLSFREARRRYYREAVALFRWKLHPDNAQREVAREIVHTHSSPEATIAAWQRILTDYENTLRTLDAE